MTRNWIVAVSVAFLSSIVAGASSQGQADDLSAIPHFYKVSDQVWAGGQPTPEQLSLLAKRGIKVVINLRVPSEGNDQGIREAAQMKELGVKYFSVPVVYSDPKFEDVDAFLKATDESLKSGPIYLHCTAGIRAGAFWAIRRVVRDGWQFDPAIEEGRKIGLSNQQFLIDFARRYIEAHIGK
jgi:uncharacterized protein (TIGR01244 family)